MKALRIILTQNIAHYKKEETVENKMTYPLPPASTIIGAIHNACNYKTYHPMDISIQGNFESMQQKSYLDHCFLNFLMDDRGILVKMKDNTILSGAFEKVATSKKKGSSFRAGNDIKIYNEELLEEYRRLKECKDEIDNYKKVEAKKTLKLIKDEKNQILEKKKELDKNSEEYIKIAALEKEIKLKEKETKNNISNYELENYTKPISKFRCLNTSLKCYEILTNVKLIIHIRSDEETLKEIEENIYNMKCIGRSEDFIDIKDVKLVDLTEDCKEEIKSKYSAYINYEDIKNNNIFFDNLNKEFSGTKYYISKNYKIIEGKRCFERKKVIYSSKYFINKTNANVLVDDDSTEKYIVNFI